MLKDLLIPAYLFLLFFALQSQAQYYLVLWTGTSFLVFNSIHSLPINFIEDTSNEFRPTLLESSSRFWFFHQPHIRSEVQNDRSSALASSSKIPPEIFSGALNSTLSYLYSEITKIFGTSFTTQEERLSKDNPGGFLRVIRNEPQSNTSCLFFDHCLSNNVKFIHQSCLNFMSALKKITKSWTETYLKEKHVDALSTDTGDLFSRFTCAAKEVAYIGDSRKFSKLLSRRAPLPIDNEAVPSEHRDESFPITKSQAKFMFLFSIATFSISGVVLILGLFSFYRANKLIILSRENNKRQEKMILEEGHELKPIEVSKKAKDAYHSSSSSSPGDSFLACTHDSETICHFSSSSTVSNVERKCYFDEEERVGPLSSRVFFRYQPVLPDELSLEVGDKVIVQHRFDDGWAVGLHLASNELGAFPLACLQAPISATSRATSPTSSEFCSFTHFTAAPIARRVSSQRLSRFISRS